LRKLFWEKLANEGFETLGEKTQFRG